MNTEEYIAQALVRARAMSDAGVWDRAPRINLRGWMQNFEERHHLPAAIVLDRLVYFNDQVSVQMLEVALQRMTSAHFIPTVTVAANDERADRLISESFWTGVQGEHPGPYDSGNLFCRRARRWVDEKHIVSVEDAQASAERGGTIVFVDDFIGSGAQMITTWERSFARIWDARRFDCHYVCCAATEYGVHRLQESRVPVQVWACYRTDARDSVRGGTRPRFVPVDEVNEIVDDFLERYSDGLMLPSYMNGDQRKYGFHGLGLTVAFSHKVPDSTLPIVWASGSGSWAPLVVTQ